MPVWHIARAPEGSVYIGRPSRWGNPFPVGDEAERGSTLERYRAYLWDEIRSGRLPLRDLAALDGAHLACYCKPRPCHGDILEAAAAWAARHADYNVSTTP